MFANTMTHAALLSLLAAPLAFTATATGGDAKQPEPGFDHPTELEADRAPAFQTDGACLIRNVTIHSAVGPATVGDVLVRDGDIAEIGSDLDAGDLMVIDGTGKHLAPGVVDTHSHMAIDRGVNEATLSITADCDISDVIDADDIDLWRAIAGGTTTIQCLHGSANAIGGRSEVLKLKWGRSADELRFPDAPQGIKFALGENPKRSNWGSPNRFPATRMGVESVFQRAFERAREYVAEKQRYQAARARGEDPAPLREDVRLEVVAGILAGEVKVHSHCYRADEILMLLRTAERFGFRIQTLQHVLEGYKVAAEMAAHGAGGSTFSDWWGYKIEAYDAIPHNAALMDEAGVLASVNSDSAELVRHLYQEAGKSVRYAGMDRVRALALVTINPARQLGVADRVGSIEVGKDADLVLLDGDPLTFTSKVEWTMVDGRIEFTRRDAFGLDGVELALEPPEEPGTVGTIEASFRPEGGPALAITGGTLHPVTAPAIENGTLVIQDGLIVAMGAGIPIPADARVIDATGQHVWPGLIALNTPVGIFEIGSVRGTDDQREIGGNQPDLRVAASINPDSAHVGVTRQGGITRSQTAPQGGGPMMGQSAVIDLDGFTWEEMLTVDRDMLHLRFPELPNAETSNKKMLESVTKNSKKAIEELEDLIEEAREYGRLVDEAREAGVAPPAFDPRLDALVPYVRGEKPVALHAGNAQTILAALHFAREQELDVVLYGLTEGWKVADAIAASGYSAVVGPVLTGNRSRFDPYDSPYANPAVLHRAGVPIAIQSEDEENPRNLAFHAATAIAYGLPREKALSAITYDAAEILGLSDELGSLAPGKIADVIVTDGDLFDTTAPVTHVLIDGVPCSLENRQTRFYERYRERLHQVQSR